MVIILSSCLNSVTCCLSPRSIGLSDFLCLAVSGQSGTGAVSNLMCSANNHSYITSYTSVSVQEPLPGSVLSNPGSLKSGALSVVRHIYGCRIRECFMIHFKVNTI